jgi:hypothetical protein
MPKWEYLVVLPANPGGGWMDARRSPELVLITAEPDLVTLLSELGKDGWEPAEMLLPRSKPDRVIFQRLRRKTSTPSRTGRGQIATSLGGAFG